MARDHARIPDDLWADHFHPGSPGRFHPRFWEDRIMPLVEFGREHQETNWLGVQRETPPAQWLRGEMCQMPSRAWHEWHWTRGLKLRRDPNYTPKARRWIRPSLRAAVYQRDGHACLHCGTRESLSLDHIYPYSLGGEDTLENLQTLCRPCNSRKGARV